MHGSPSWSFPILTLLWQHTPHSPPLASQGLNIHTQDSHLPVPVPDQTHAQSATPRRAARGGQDRGCGNAAELQPFQLPAVHLALSFLGVCLQAPSHVYSGHSSHVTNVEFLCDDSHLISTGGKDTSIMQWRVV